MEIEYWKGNWKWRHGEKTKVARDKSTTYAYVLFVLERNSTRRSANKCVAL